MSTDNQIQFTQLLKFSYGLILVSFALTYWYADAHSWSWFGQLGFWAFPAGATLAAIVFYVLVVLISHRLLRLNSFYRLIEQLHFLVRDLTWPQIVILSVLAGVGEELLFRGFVQSWLLNAVGVYTAITLSSLIFGLLHAMTLYYFLFAFGLSLGFGALFHVSDSMVLVISVHAAYDVIALGVIAKYPKYVGVVVGAKSDSESKLEL